jgi:hypothetical protein
MMKLAAWVRAHPYTTATPFILAALCVIFRLLVGGWLKAVVFVLAMAASATFNVWLRRRR